jgi:hypothetical protein
MRTAKPLFPLVALCCLLALLVAATAGPADELASTLAITISQALPLRSQPVVLGARYHGEAAAGFTVTFEQLAAPGQLAVPLGTAPAERQPDGSLWAQLQWTPATAGFITCRASARVGEAILAAGQIIPVVERELHFVWFGSGPGLK